ncbi:MFS transporter [Leucobacter celer]|uniref:MFS transporter n=1 Tax=Leucobacter celer TaxID=668625 RepID=UPI0019D3F135|nr:MFS transporter [Leucobacter celer]
MLLALAFGTFAIGSGEFASMGIIQLFASDMGLSIPTASWAITAYALGVVIGAPAITILTARWNRRRLLLSITALFVVGNLLSSVANDLGVLMVARFLAGMPQGAYFGAGAVVATYVMGKERSGQAFSRVAMGLTVAMIVGAPLGTAIGQLGGWRGTYLAIAALGLISLVALHVRLPRTEALAGGSIARELSALRRPAVWATACVAALGISSIFAVYTYIGPMITDVVRLDPSVIPFALAAFGLGMTVGNIIGGRIADRSRWQGLVGGYAATLAILVVLALTGSAAWMLLLCLFGIGVAMMGSIPTIQVRMISAAPEAPTLMGALNMGALNLANALGAWAGSVVIAAGYGFLASAWAGFALTAAGLALFAMTWTIDRGTKPPDTAA